MLIRLRPRLARRCLSLSPLSLPCRRLVVVAAVAVAVAVRLSLSSSSPCRRRRRGFSSWVLGCWPRWRRRPSPALPLPFHIWHTGGLVHKGCHIITPTCLCMSIFQMFLTFYMSLCFGASVLFFRVIQRLSHATAVLSPQHNSPRFRHLGAPTAWYTWGAILPGCLCALFRVRHTEFSRTSAVFFPRI